MNEDVITITKLNEVFLKLDLTISQAMELKGHLECYVPGYMFHPRFKNRVWSGKVSFFDVGRSILPLGLLPDFFSFCKKFGYEYVLNFDTTSLSFGMEESNLELFLKAILPSSIVARDYQQKAIFKSLTNKRGCVVSATGSGKSLIIYSIIRFLVETGMKILLVVPNTSLVEQMYSDFKSYGWGDIYNQCSILYSGKTPDFSKSLLISTWQSVCKKRDDFFSKFDAFLVDECHLAKAYSIQTIGKKCINAQYRLGFTGTLPTEKSDLYNIFGYLGPKIFELKAGELIDKGVLSRITIANIIAKYPDDVIQKNKRRIYDEEVNTVMEFSPRNKIFNYVFSNLPEKQNTLILCSRIEHLNSITDYLNQTLPSKYKVFVIYGDVKPEDRENIRKSMEHCDDVVLVGTYATMSTGINIRKINNIIFASSYKSKIKVLQSIGRGLRTHESKDRLILFDIVDDLRYKKRSGEYGYNHLWLHFIERMKYYKEQGFESHNISISL